MRGVIADILSNDMRYLEYLLTCYENINNNAPPNASPPNLEGTIKSHVKHHNYI